MTGLNKATLYGHLGRDPELRYTANKKAVCSFSMATTESYKDAATGKWQNKATWHNIVVWGKRAENCNKMLAKGSAVLVEGKISNRSYDDKDGNKRYVSEIIADTVIFTQKAEERESQPQDPGGYQEPRKPGRAPGTPGPGVQSTLEDDGELPF